MPGSTWGETLDVAIMEFGKGVFEVKATSGDTQIGGTDMNQRFLEHFAQRFQAETGADPRTDRQAMARFLKAAEIAKSELSAATTAHISLPFLLVVGQYLLQLTLLQRGERGVAGGEVHRVPVIRVNQPIVP